MSKKREIIAYSYYLIRISAFCNMHHFSCVMEYAEKLGLVEFCDKYNMNKTNSIDFYVTEMHSGYVANVKDLVDEELSTTEIRDKILKLRKEIKNEETSRRTEKKKTSG